MVLDIYVNTLDITFLIDTFKLFRLWFLKLLFNLWYSSYLS
jgi:hypothetical protein